jgi:hypothetical protein
MEVPVEHFVAMPVLPPGLKFPRDFADRIRHDPASGRLIFRGFMSKADFDRLCFISDDWAFRRSLEELFRLCTPEEGKRPLLERLTRIFGL